MPLSKHNVQPVDPILTQFMNDYSNEEYVMGNIFSKIQVKTESGTYYTFTGKERFRDVPTRRAPGSKYYRMEMTPHTGTYQTQEDGVEMPVDKRLQANALDPFDPYKSAAEIVKDLVLLRRERTIATLISNAAVFTNTEALAGPDRWDDANSEPVQKVNQRKLSILDGCGKVPNTMVMPYEIYLALREHPVLVDKIPSDMPKIITPEMLKKFFDIERLFVCAARYNAAEEGQTVDLDPVMGKNVFLGYVNPAPARDKPSVGYLIQVNDMLADSYYENQTKSDVVRATINETAEVVSIDTAYLITTVIS